MKTFFNSYNSILKLSSVVLAFSFLPVNAQEVTLYSHRHYEADDKLYEKFTKATGIKVNVVKASADALIERIKAEGKESPADLLIAADAGRLVRAQDAGILQSI